MTDEAIALLVTTSSEWVVVDVQRIAVWEEPPRGAVVDAAAMLRLPGLEQMRQVIDPPAMGRLTGLDLLGSGPGEATFALPISEWLRWSCGEVPGGVLALPGDAALGCALQTELPAGVAYTTAELSLTYLRPLAPGDRVSAHGRCLHAGRRLGLSDVSIRDAGGRLVAHGTSRATIFAPSADLGGRIGGTVPPPPRVGGPAGEAATPDPWQRPVLGEILDPAAQALTGRERLERQIAGELPLPPLHHLLGLRPTVVEKEGVARCVMPVTGWLATPWGWPQGGFIALLADAALGLAVESAMPAGRRFATVDLKVNFLRPVVGDGSELIAVGTVVHQGRTLAVATSEVIDARGKPVALATGSAALL
jgi:uncharacterized protein (TIGR00369 family)